jgi:hypothetical protein
MILFLLLGGAVVNVAVAWAGASLGGYGLKTSASAPSDWEWSVWNRYELSRDQFNEVQRKTRWGSTVTAIMGSDSSARALEAGLPFRALRSYLLSTQKAGIVRVDWALRFPTTTGGRHLPLCPAWPGFAINTFFYGALLWLVLFGPSALRRHLRMRRGLCPVCAYPVGESATCTECGKSVGRRRAAVT